LVRCTVLVRTARREEAGTSQGITHSAQVTEGVWNVDPILSRVRFEVAVKWGTSKVWVALSASQARLSFRLIRSRQI
jgi:hypothetical protein